MCRPPFRTSPVYPVIFIDAIVVKFRDWLCQQPLFELRL